MPYSVLDICIRREGGEPWGFKLVGGQDVGKVLRVSKVYRELLYGALSVYLFALTNCACCY